MPKTDPASYRSTPGDGPGPDRTSIFATPNNESESRLASLLHLASDNYTTDDARTWLSSSLACRRTCLEGLEEKGRAQTHARAHNLTVLLGEALNLHARGRGFRKGKKL